MKHWYKASSHMTIDPKLALIAARAKCYRHEVIALWSHLMERSNQVDQDGYLGSLDFEVIDHLLEFTGGRAQKIYQAMEDKLIKDGIVINWRKFQIDSTAAERKRAQREREKEKAVAKEVVTESRGVTPCHSDIRDCHDVTPEESRVEEIRIDVDDVDDNAPDKIYDWLLQYFGGRFVYQPQSIKNWLVAGADFRLYITSVAEAYFKVKGEPPRSLSWLDDKIAASIRIRNNPLNTKEKNGAIKQYNKPNYGRQSVTDHVIEALAAVKRGEI